MKDPICGMEVEAETAAATYEYDGRSYAFCSQGCLAKFRADPTRYAAPERKGGESSAGAGDEYTCPMHPQVVRSEPGSCPICGLALEPRTVRADGDEVSPELRDMTRRFWVSLVLTVPVFVLAMSDLLPDAPVQHALAWRRIVWIELALATPVVLLGGWPFF